jgi:hypothetical protein
VGEDPEGLKAGSFVARFDDRGQTRKGWVLFLQDGKVGLRIGAGDAKAEIRNVTKKALLKPAHGNTSLPHTTARESQRDHGRCRWC